MRVYVYVRAWIQEDVPSFDIGGAVVGDKEEVALLNCKASVCGRVCACMSVYVCMCMCVYVCVHVCEYVSLHKKQCFTHTHTHTHTHA